LGKLGERTVRRQRDRQAIRQTWLRPRRASGRGEPRLDRGCNPAHQPFQALAAELSQRSPGAWKSRDRESQVEATEGIPIRFEAQRGLKGPREKAFTLLPGQPGIVRSYAMRGCALLNIAVKTAETHRSNIMLKLDIHSIAKLVLYAVRNEIIHVQSPTADAFQGNGAANVTLQSVN
jgi:hypothetical protein